MIWLVPTMDENTSLCVYTPTSSQSLCPSLGYSTSRDNKVHFLCLSHVTMCMNHTGDLTVSSIQEDQYLPGGTVSTLLLKRVHRPVKDYLRKEKR